MTECNYSTPIDHEEVLHSSVAHSRACSYMRCKLVMFIEHNGMLHGIYACIHQ